MKRHRASRTADAAAAVRANHFLRDRPLIFEDPLALQLTSPMWRIICGSSVLHRLVICGLLADMRPVHGLILVRSRYAEDQLQLALSKGVRRYVIVGAGLDSFAYRRPEIATSLQVYELDHPASQGEKIKRLKRSVGDLPGHVQFIPVDFEKKSVGEAIIEARVSNAEPFFFSWLGNTFYLTNDAVFNTLSSIATVAPQGSEIVFDYFVNEELIPTEERIPLRRTKEFAKRRGEPIIGVFDPIELVDRVSKLGFELVENLSTAAQNERYFQCRKDDLKPMPGGYIAHFRVK